MPTPSQIAATCVGQLRAGKIKAKAEGREMTWTEVGDIIEKACTYQVPPADNRTPADFGDRKKIPPTPEQVSAYSAFIGYPMDGQAWCDSYAQKGWKVGKTRMKDWQAAVRTWKTNGYGHDGIVLKDLLKVLSPAGGGKDYSRL